MMKDLSIIIPHRNSRDYLKRLLAQIPTSHNIEILVIDDNSDNPPFKIVSMKTNAKMLQCSPKITGAGAARNLGLEIAQGKWLLFADADDQFTPDAFNIINEYFNINTDIVFFPPTATHIKEDLTPDRHLAYVKLVKEHSKTDPNWLRVRFHPPWSKLIRRQLIEDSHLRFDEVLTSNDIMFSLYAGLAAKSFQTDHRSIYCVTQGNSGSLTSRTEKSAIQSRFDVHCKYNDVLRSSGMWRYRMTILPPLRKALKISLLYGMALSIIALRRRQPFFDNLQHMLELWRHR